MPNSWYENLPAVALDYKVHIDAGKEDCYFQYVDAGATFYVNFQVCNCLLHYHFTENAFLIHLLELRTGITLEDTRVFPLKF